VHLAQIANWIQLSRSGNASTPANPPGDVVQAMIERADELTKLPVIDQVVRCPVIAPNGTLVTARGYSVAARVWYEPDPMLIIPPIAERPTTEDLLRARRLIIDDLLVDFPFKSSADRALAFELTLLPFVRPLIQGPTPLHVFTAPTPGTGKGLCAKACLLPGFGVNISAIPEITDEAEMIKQLGTIFLAGRPLVLFDNVRHRVDSGALSLALTEPGWQKRILGINRDMDVPIRCVWAMTGNNIEMSDEIGRRAPHIELDVTLLTDDANVAEHPWRRTGFKHPDLLGWAKANRGGLIWACLTIIRSWQAAGSKPWSGNPPGSYDDWARIMGGLVEHIGGSTFLSNLDETYDRSVSDRDRECGFVQMWVETYGVDEIGSQELLLLSIKCEDLFALATTGAGKARNTSFGMAMHKLAGQVRCGWRIERGRRRSTWSL